MKLPLITFAEFVGLSATRKQARARAVVARSQKVFSPKEDFWKRIRDMVISHHARGSQSHGDLMAAMIQVGDHRRRDKYRRLLETYIGFLRERRVEWFDPPQGEWSSSELIVRLNPDVGLYLDGVPHVLKLWFKDRELRQDGRECVRTLLSAELRSGAPEGAVFGLMDLQRGQLHVRSRPDMSFLPRLDEDAKLLADNLG